MVRRLSMWCGGLVVACAAAAAEVPFADPIDTPATPSSRAASIPMTAVARAGSRFVAAGLRGTVLLSDDIGQHWRQVAAPVSSDLVSVYFATPEQGWISGQDGVILHTADGGVTWRKQLDGRRLEVLLKAAYSARAAAGDAGAKYVLSEIGHDFENGTQQPLLGLWFKDEHHGYAVGSFGIIVETKDGGATWTCAMDRVDNPGLLHLFSIAGKGDHVYISSEKGTVFRFDAAKGRFVPSSTGYQGSLFGLVADGDNLIAFGLRGQAFRSTDGALQWQTLLTGVETGLNGGTVTDGQRILIASQGGQLLASDDQGLSFRAVPGLVAAPFAGVAAQRDVAVVVGQNGVQTVALR